MTTAQQLRLDLAALVTLAGADIAVLKRLSEAEALEALHDLLPGLVATYGAAAATVAADWYDEYREQAEAPKTFRAIPIEPSDRGTQALIGWAASEATTDDAFWTLLQGGLQRRINDHSRLTVAGSSIADPSARGWRRTGVGECDWCRMLIGRGFVYSESTVTFEAHDHCRCGAEPDFT